MLTWWGIMLDVMDTLCGYSVWRIHYSREGEGEGEVAVFSAKRWDRRSRIGLIESATPCHDAEVMGLYLGSNPVHLTVLAAMSEDYTTAPQHLHCSAHWFTSVNNGYRTFEYF
eukprot:Seg1725.6 transcript_id=Seg1725.6/GoldUCD/mRNA.D3Y31 product="hypothetical protein" pseudo=true protein_id=Seg1725.6/GoldUCD/D3Y31